MSNWKHGYGWVGHILAPYAESQASKKHNVVAIDSELFARIAADYSACKLPKAIEARQLGVTSEEIYFLAVGVSFSEGFENYGTIFAEAELRAGSGCNFESSSEVKYRMAMRETYGMTLPPARLMVGCSSER